MHTTLQGFELSVAILMDDLASAKEVATALRQNNILAHHYSSLDEFWVASNIQTPDLVIIDVTKMSLGSVQFKAHPKVVDGSLCFAFFSKESTKILLQSTYGLKAFGYIHNDGSLNLQIMSLVEARRVAIESARVIKDLEGRVQRLQSRSQRLISDRSSAEEFKSHFEFIRSFCADIENESMVQDFTQGLLSKLEHWDAIDAYGVYELNQSGQKLVSPDVAKKKYHPFPALWLGQANPYGIENFAIEMAAQVAHDLFEGEPVVLKIFAGSKQPDMILYVSFKEERMASFPWDVLESMLSSSLRRLKLHQQLPQYASQFLPMWEALDNMDKMQRSGVDTDTRILCLSLIPLVDVAKKRIQNKFYWSAFFNDFFIQLSGRIQKSTKLSLFGPWHVMFFIPKENMEVESLMLQTFVKQFAFWKFFEDNSQILTEDMVPTLKLVPASSAHYLRLFEKEFEEMSEKEETKKLMSQMTRGEHKRLPI
jgi:DNA-binding NarL/FixJ family response regulator